MNNIQVENQTTPPLNENLIPWAIEKAQIEDAFFYGNRIGNLSPEGLLKVVAWCMTNPHILSSMKRREEKTALFLSEMKGRVPNHQLGIDFIERIRRVLSRNDNEVLAKEIAKEINQMIVEMSE